MVWRRSAREVGSGSGPSGPVPQEKDCHWAGVVVTAGASSQVDHEEEDVLGRGSRVAIIVGDRCDGVGLRQCRCLVPDDESCGGTVGAVCVAELDTDEDPCCVRSVLASL